MADWKDLAQTELVRITGLHHQRKRNTILALVETRLAGRAEESVWSLPETCSRNTYHSKWKQDETFASVLANVTALATKWQSGRRLAALEEAAEELALAAPDAVAALTQLLQSANEKTRRMAAVNILDRAGMETAQKMGMGHQPGPGGMEHLEDAELAQVVANLLVASGVSLSALSPRPAGTPTPISAGTPPTAIDEEE